MPLAFRHKSVVERKISHKSPISDEKYLIKISYKLQNYFSRKIFTNLAKLYNIYTIDADKLISYLSMFVNILVYFVIYLKTKFEI